VLVVVVVLLLLPTTTTTTYYLLLVLEMWRQLVAVHERRFFDTFTRLMSAVGGGGGEKPAEKKGVVLPAVDPLLVPTGAPPGFKPLAPLSAVPAGLSRATLPDEEERLIVVKTDDGAHRVMGGLCPHAKGELHLGDMESIDGALCVTCPRHRKKFPGGLSIECGTGAVRVRAEPLPEANFDPSWKVGVRETAVHAGWLFYR
jgi:nitrite reductase/ring-hydroxylating ferredoxin subunit